MFPNISVSLLNHFSLHTNIAIILNFVIFIKLFFYYLFNNIIIIWVYFVLFCLPFIVKNLEH